MVAAGSTWEYQKAGEDLWEQSIQQLSEEDQQRLVKLRGGKLDVLDAVLESVNDKKKVCLDKRWTYKGRDGKPKALRDLCDKTIAWVSKFKAIGDSVVKLDVSGNAALPWTGISLLLQIAGNESKIFGRMLEGVERISFLVTRYALVEQVYFNNAGANGLVSRLSHDEMASLKGDVVVLYGTIMHFLASASSYYEDNTAKRMAKSLVETPESIVDEFLDNISSKEDAISRSQRLLGQSALNALYDEVGEVRLAVEHLRTLDEPINRIAAQLSDIQDRLTESDRVALLKWLSTIPHDRHHATKKSARLEASGEWLLQNADFRQWANSSSSSILWLHGMPGCGKSFLLSFVVDHFSGSHNPSHKPLSGYFYCSRNASEPERGEAASILRTILKQLCSASANEPVREPVASTFEKRKRAAERRGQVVEPLSLDDTTAQIIQVLNARQDPAFIMIDALDECDPYSVHDLLDSLEQILREATGLTKIFVTSRDDGDIRNRLEATTNVYVGASYNSDDINRFIDTEVEKAILGRRLLGGRAVPAPLKKDILETLKRKSGGMFRWVSLQLENICNPRKFKTPQAVRNALGKLPTTLKESYDIIYEQILEYDDEQRQIAERTITFLLCLQGPLTNDSFVAAVSSVFDDSEIDEETIVDICCNLVVSDNGFRFVHLSAQEFLLERPEYSAQRQTALLAHACLSVYCSEKPPSCSDEHWQYRTGAGAARQDKACWIHYAGTFLATHLTMLEDSRKAVPEVGIGSGLCSMVKHFLGPQHQIEDTPFKRWIKNVEGVFLRTSRAGFRVDRSNMPHPLRFIFIFGLKDLLIHAGLLLPCQGRAHTELSRQIETADCPSQFRNAIEHRVFYRSLLEQKLCIARDVVVDFWLSGASSRYQSLARITQFVDPDLIPHLFEAALNERSDRSAFDVEAILSAYPDMTLTAEMIMCMFGRENRLDVGMKRKILSVYLRQQHQNGLPDLETADYLDLIGLVVEKDTRIIGNTAILSEIWKQNSSCWKKKTWSILETLFSRKMDVSITSWFFPHGYLPAFPLPESERFFKMLFRQPANSVRIQESGLRHLAEEGHLELLQIIRSLRPDTVFGIDMVRAAIERPSARHLWTTLLALCSHSRKLTATVVNHLPVEGVDFYLRLHKDILIPDFALISAFRNSEDPFGVFQFLVDSGRLENNPVTTEVILAAFQLRQLDMVVKWVDMFLAREWILPNGDLLRLGLEKFFHRVFSERVECKRVHRAFRYLADKGITPRLVDLCHGSFLDAVISELGVDAKMTANSCLELLWQSPSEREVSETLHRAHRDQERHERTLSSATGRNT